MAGERVFIGALQLPFRREVAGMAHEAGAAVEPNVTKATTLLIVGKQDIEKLAGHNESGKHRKAETLIVAGHPIRILGEFDFGNLPQLAILA